MPDETKVAEEKPKGRIVRSDDDLRATLKEVEVKLAEVNAQKNEFKSRKEVIPPELEKVAMKLRRQRRFCLKRLGMFVPVPDRPKKEKPPKPEKVAKKKKGEEAEAEGTPAETW